MNRILKTLLSLSVISSTIYAGANITSEETSITEIPTESKSALNSFFSSTGIGGSKITLGDEYHKAFVINSKTGYKFDNNVSVFMLGESNYYRHMGDINDMGISGFGVGYDIPYTNNKLTLSTVVGLGMNINYNRVFNKFSESYDFGFAYRANLTYQISKHFNVNISYSKFDFNTNATNLEDTKPEIIGISFVYSFNAKSFLD